MRAVQKCNVRDPLWRIKDRILAALSTCSLAEITTETPYQAPEAMPVSLTRSAIADRNTSQESGELLRHVS